MGAQNPLIAQSNRFLICCGGNSRSVPTNLTRGPNRSNMPLRSFTLKVKSWFDGVETLPAEEGLVTNRGFINSNLSAFAFSTVNSTAVSDNYLEMGTGSAALQGTGVHNRLARGSEGAVEGPGPSDVRPCTMGCPWQRRSECSGISGGQKEFLTWDGKCRSRKYREIIVARHMVFIPWKSSIDLQRDGGGAVLHLDLLCLYVLLTSLELCGMSGNT